MLLSGNSRYCFSIHCSLLHLYTASTCARSYSESDGEVRLCTTLGSTFVGSEVAISSADTSAIGR